MRLDQIGLGKLLMKAHYMDYHITLSGKDLRYQIKNMVK